MRICMILEGCYPYVRGGLSSWMHEYILAMPQHEFVLWVIGAESKNKGQYKYQLPPNVVEIHEVFLDDALNIPVIKGIKTHFTPEEVQAHSKLIACSSPDWDVLFRSYNVKRTNVNAFLMSEDFLNIILEICKKDYTFIAFSEFFHTIRSMLLPTLYLMSQEIPQADVYHSTATGYGGLLGAMASSIKKRPLIVTEHGIYSREREEELLRATWVKPYFKKLWISLFYMLARVGYDYAVSVTALYAHANEIQAELGCDRKKLKVIENGIALDRFANVPPKTPNGYIDIGAIIRIHPIKDVKTMIYAFFELKARVPNARLYILGDTDDEEYRAECMELVEQLKVQDIYFEGNVNVVQYLEKFDFTVLTSISEAQPLSVLESLAAERPCVTTDVGCCREILEGTGIDNFGRAGICTMPMHTQSIANAMEFLSTHEQERRQMGLIGAKRVRSHYVHKDSMDKYLKNYAEVLRKWQA